MARKEREGPRLEKRKHLEAEARLKASVLEGRGYPGKDEDLRILHRKARELSLETLKRVIRGGGLT